MLKSKSKICWLSVKKNMEEAEVNTAFSEYSFRDDGMVLNLGSMLCPQLIVSKLPANAQHSYSPLL